jgi:hypothetical protein
MAIYVSSCDWLNVYHFSCPMFCRERPLTLVKGQKLVAVDALSLPESRRWSYIPFSKH